MPNIGERGREEFADRLPERDRNNIFQWPEKGKEKNSKVNEKQEKKLNQKEKKNYLLAYMTLISNWPFIFTN